MNLMRDKTIADIRSYLEEGGYLTTDEEFDFTTEYDAFKYLGYIPDGKHRYLIGIYNEDETPPYLATFVYVFLGSNGNLAAEYAAVPCREFYSGDDLLTYIEKRCN